MGIVTINIFRIISRVHSILRSIAKISRIHESVHINQGRILSRLNEQLDSGNLHDYEFQVFSQFGEDGILQYLTRSLDIRHKTFIEFGVEDFQESNCRFLMMKDLWSGFVIDGSSRNIKSIRNSYYFWQYQLDTKCEFINVDNICSVLNSTGFDKNVGVLSVDIDGMDFHVLNKLQDWSPSIMVVEYNSHFGKSRPVSVPYRADFMRSKAHYSNQYFGASLPAFSQLACQMDMALVGVNSAGHNAFFVRKNLLNSRVKEVSIEECFKDMQFRDGRSLSGHLSGLHAYDSRELIGDLPLVDTITGEKLIVRDLAIE